MSPGNMIDFDCHVHTVFSGDSLLTPAGVIKKALSLGLGGVAVTDHNEIKGALETAELARTMAPGFIVIVGQEIQTSAGELQALFIKEKIPHGLTPGETVELVKRQGGLVVIPHPFDPVRRKKLSAGGMASIISVVDALEGVNGRAFTNISSEYAIEYAKISGKPITAGSDAHFSFELGRVYLRMPVFKDARSFISSLNEAEPHFAVSGVLPHVLTGITKRLPWNLRRKLANFLD